VGCNKTLFVDPQIQILHSFSCVTKCHCSFDLLRKKKKTLLAQELCRKNKPALTCGLKFTNTGVQSQGKRVGLKAFMVFLTLHISNFRVWKCFTQHSNGELCRLSDIAENNPGVMMTWQEYSIILHQCGLHDF